MKWFDYTALTIVIIGAVNWLLIGIFRFDLVAFLFGNLSWLSRIVYTLVGLCGLYLRQDPWNVGIVKEPADITHLISKISQKAFQFRLYPEEKAFFFSFLLVDSRIHEAVHLLIQHLRTVRTHDYGNIWMLLQILIVQNHTIPRKFGCSSFSA